jgi:hypothetical protein
LKCLIRFVYIVLNKTFCGRHSTAFFIISCFVRRLIISGFSR